MADAVLGMDRGIRKCMFQSEGNTTTMPDDCLGCRAPVPKPQSIAVPPSGALSLEEQGDLRP